MPHTLGVQLPQDDENRGKDYRKLICLTPRGRLGNKMFQFAAGYSLSKIYDRRLVLEGGFSVELETLFRMRLDMNGSAPYTVGSCQGIKKDKQITRQFQRDLFTRRSNVNTATNPVAYFTSWKYLYKHMQDIFRCFTVNDKYLDFASSTIRKYCPVNATSIGIHVRRGDKADQMSLAPWSFQQAMDYYSQRYIKLHFFVASDDTKWCRLNFKDITDLTLLTGDAYEDFAVLCECEHRIISVRTYSLWSGLLAKGTVVYYNSSITVLKNDDIYLPEWIPMAGYDESMSTS